MIYFIDTNTGNVFNGSKPYVHWFDGAQSVGLNYCKKFIVATDDSNITIDINSEVFSLVNDHLIGYWEDSAGHPVYREFNDKQYLDLDVIKTNHLYHGDEYAQVGNYRVFSFNIIAQGKYVGEVRDTFTINGEEFAVGADFTDENEALGINLTNFGAEISNEVQRAIYEKRIDEQKTDFILLNRKFKELLNEYINILANKGSYKSLINSLNWFEYGDLVKIYEYWKHPEPNRDYLAKHDITQIVTSSTEHLLSSEAKTTFEGISAALEKIKMLDSEIVYENDYQGATGEVIMLDEPNPQLEKVSMLWSKNDMALKMTLLGNFFATYFMPVHLDLIHSTIEDIIYSTTLKITTIPKLERIDIQDNIYTIKCDLDKTYHLGNVEAFAEATTPFGLTVDPTDPGKQLDILGVGAEPNQGAAFFPPYKQFFKGIGVIIPFDCTLEGLENGCTITDAHLHIYRDGVLVNDRDTDQINHIPEEGVINIMFSILLQHIGDYHVQLEFRRSDGVVYIKMFDFTVDGNTMQTLSMYRLVPRFDKQGMNTTIKDGKRVEGKFNIKQWIIDMDSAPTDEPLSIENVADYVLNPVQMDRHAPTYIQFISATTKSIYDTVHTNQVMIFRTINNADLSNITIKNNLGGSIEFSSVVNTINPDTGISSETPHVVWFKMNDRAEYFVVPSNDNISEWDGTRYTYYIGINTTPNTEDMNITSDPDNIKIKYSVSCADKQNIKIWIRDAFVPYFYKLEKIGDAKYLDESYKGLNNNELYKKRIDKSSYTIRKEDVVCFLPDMKCFRRPYGFEWKFRNASTGLEITPIGFRNYKEPQGPTGSRIPKVDPDDKRNTELKAFPSILQPMFGRYDLRILPDPGYYDITLNYKMDNAQYNNNTKTVSSMFIIEK